MMRRSRIFSLAAFFVMAFMFPMPGPCHADDSRDGRDGVEGEGRRLFPIIMEHDYAYRRAAAWLDALGNARPLLPNVALPRLREMGMSSRMAVMALCACLFPVADITPPGTSDGGVRVLLTIPPDYRRKLSMLLARPTPVAEKAILISQMAEALAHIRRDWPRTVPNNPTQLAFLEEQADLLEDYWLAVNFHTGDEEPEAQGLIMEEILRKLPECAPFWIMLARNRLASGQPRKALEACDEALNLCHEFLDGPGLQGAWTVLEAETCALRAEIHLRLHHDALARADLASTILLLERNGFHDDLLKRMLSLYGNLAVQRNDYDEMCAAFQKKCALGDCGELAHARRMELCLP